MKSACKIPVVLLVVLGVVLVSCVGGEGEPIPPAPDQEPTTIWSALLDLTPVPYAGPLPLFEETQLDGTYARFDPSPPQWWSCLRCADYRMAGGVWRLQFDRGVMRIYYEVTGWKSLASYEVTGDRLVLFNDPYCKQSRGEYRWSLEEGILVLETLDDPCSFDLRGQNLSTGTWAACPLEGAGAVEPRGCSDPAPSTVSVPVSPEGLTVTVHKADMRLDTRKPNEIINAHGMDPALPEDVFFSYSDESMPYGVNRVLWAEKDWTELTFSKPFATAGVQFRGSYVIGWARVLFDGVEVWRGDTAEIWSEGKVHGGYIEIAGFELGNHILRVERLDVDSRPVVVAFFGLSR